MIAGLVLMFAGGIAMALSATWTIQIVGRLVDERERYAWSEVEADPEVDVDAALLCKWS